MGSGRASSLLDPSHELRKEKLMAPKAPQTPKAASNVEAKQEVKAEAPKKKVYGNKLFLLKNLKARIFHIESRVIQPGVNQLTEEEADRVQKNPWFEKYIRMGFIAWVSGKSPKDAIKEEGYPLASVEEAEAEKIIKQTADIALLQSWSNKEKRPGIANAIKDRIEKILNPPTEEGSDLPPADEDGELTPKEV